MTVTNGHENEQVAQRRARARQLYQTGDWTAAAIARDLGVSVTSVRKYLRGLPPTKNSQSRTGRAQAAQSPSGNELLVATRTEQAFTLRLQGMSYRQIALAMALDHRTVRNYVERELDSRVSPKVQDYRELESARLDEYLQGLQPALESDDMKLRIAATDTALRVSVRRARLLGLDSPVRVDVVKTEITQEDLAFQELLREADARNARVRDDIIEAQVVNTLVPPPPALPAGPAE